MEKTNFFLWMIFIHCVHKMIGHDKLLSWMNFKSIPIENLAFIRKFSIMHFGMWIIIWQSWCSKLMNNLSYMGHMCFICFWIWPCQNLPKPCRSSLYQYMGQNEVIFGTMLGNKWGIFICNWELRIRHACSICIHGLNLHDVKLVNISISNDHARKQNWSTSLYYGNFWNDETRSSIMIANGNGGSFQN
jgi:hypothetical protein